MDGLADQQAERCDEFQRRDIHVGFENQYPTVVTVLQCGINNLTGKPIVTLLKVIKGNRSLYTVSRIWRLEPTVAEDGSTALSKAEELIPTSEFAAWSATLRDVLLCDSELPAHACPDQSPNQRTD